MSSCEIFNAKCMVEKSSGPSVRQVTLHEKKNKDKKNICIYIAELGSPRRIVVYKVDDCLIGEGEEKCDFLILDCDRRAAYFLELKGSDLFKAISQLDASLDRLLPTLKSSMPGVSVHARIAISRVNKADLKDSKYKKFEKKIRFYGGTLKQQSQKFIERLP